MLVTSRPHAESARIAASLPEPGPLTITSTVFNPWIKAAFVADSADICAAYGVDFFEPQNPRPPAASFFVPVHWVFRRCLLLKNILLMVWNYGGIIDVR